MTASAKASATALAIAAGGAIAPPAVIANAVADAFRSIGASFNETPLTPRRVSEAIDRARRAQAFSGKVETGFPQKMRPPEAGA